MRPPFLTLCLIAGVGCAAPDGDVAATQDALAPQSATIHFQGDFDEVVTGSLLAGEPIALDYDESRVTKCRGYKYGQPAWSIVAHYRVDGGVVKSVPVAGPNVTEPPTIAVATGALEMWFVNSDVWGCVAYDSAFGQNYHFRVDGGVAWAGLASSVISRCTDLGDPCPGDYVPLADGFVYDTWARQRALISNAYFEAWEPGITDWDNPDLWQQLDVQMHYRFDPSVDFTSEYVDFDRRVGNNARYAVGLRALDPFGGNTITDPQDCPDFPFGPAANPAYVEATVELYFTINGQQLRPAPNEVYRGTYQDYAGLYAVCP
jgi:hypothetical protein